ncbi:hypothetical protein BP6252_11969 [Coleophoma cylindrospora]|uniref:C2H2-type domain-containing protein n=1 Tax=Coleophoma cylindrospora TaxID=1849047 RepID=A0A3D8QFF2_9HELO|nr:hypothetical protein BP6252_11969 [Coleophoma cylindrospora]
MFPPSSISRAGHDAGEDIENAQDLDIRTRGEDKGTSIRTDDGFPDPGLLYKSKFNFTTEERLAPYRWKITEWYSEDHRTEEEIVALCMQSGLSVSISQIHDALIGWTVIPSPYRYTKLAAVHTPRFPDDAELAISPAKDVTASIDNKGSSGPGPAWLELQNYRDEEMIRIPKFHDMSYRPLVDHDNVGVLKRQQYLDSLPLAPSQLEIFINDIQPYERLAVELEKDAITQRPCQLAGYKRSVPDVRHMRRAEMTTERIASSMIKGPSSEKSIKMVGRMTRGSSATEEDSWSSEEETIPAVPKLSGHQRSHVESVMETFWDVMNKYGRSCVREKTKASGDAGASSTDRSSQQTSSETSADVVPSQRSLGKRPANNDKKDNEDRCPKRNRKDSYDPIDASEKIKLSCPYRKRNRHKYNIYTHRTCALSGFPDIARVKEHLYRTHRAPIHCYRCAMVFKDQQELKTHSKAKTVCELKEGEPSEGFDNDTYERLKRRKKSFRDQPVEARWVEIYCLLFSDDDQDNIPSPFWEPPVDEPVPATIAIEDYIRQEVPRRVRTQIENRLAAGDYSYDLALMLSDQMMEILEAQIDTCISEHRETTSKNGHQERDHLDPAVPFLRSPTLVLEHPATDSSSVSRPAPQSLSGDTDDWYTYLQQPGDAPWDLL